MSVVSKVRAGLSILSDILLGGPKGRIRGELALLRYEVARMSKDEQERFAESAPYLDGKHIEGARLFARREAMLEILPKGGRVAEVGSFAGYFSDFIARVARPADFHLIDIDFSPLPKEEIAQALAPGRLHLHQGDSADTLASFPAEHFDWIYVDADHSYDSVVRDLAAADRALKPGGFLMCNDYTNWSTVEVTPYGVARAVNELILRDDWRVTGYALHHRGHPEILIQKPAV